MNDIFLIQGSTLTDTADTIRTYIGGDGISPKDFPKKIVEVYYEGKGDAEPSLQGNKSVTPTAAGVTVEPDTNYDGLSKVTVEGDSDLKSSNIKAGVTIFGVAGNYAGEGCDHKFDSIAVTPEAKSRTYRASDNNLSGYSTFTVNGDDALVPGNIKKDATIFGVKGEYDTDTTATATVNDIREGETAWVNGTEITGEVPTRSTDNVSIDTSSSTTKVYATAAAGIYDSNVKKEVMNKVSIPAPGISVNADTGVITATVDSSSAGYYTGAGNETTTQMNVRSAAVITPSSEETNTIAIAKGEYATGNIEVKNDVNLVPGNIREGATIFGVAGDYKSNNIKYGEKLVRAYGGDYAGGTAPYPFNLIDGGYWESSNKSVSAISTASLGRFSFEVFETCDVTFEVINYAPSSTYAFFSELDIEMSWMPDTNTSMADIKYSLQGQGNQEVQELTYENVSPGQHTISVKFTRHGAHDIGNNSVRFRLKSPMTDELLPRFAEGDRDLIAENVKPDVNIYGITGNMPEVQFKAPTVSVPVENDAKLRVYFSTDCTGYASEETQVVGDVSLTTELMQKADTALKPENIKSGTTIFGVTGEYAPALPKPFDIKAVESTYLFSVGFAYDILDADETESNGDFVEKYEVRPGSFEVSKTRYSYTDQYGIERSLCRAMLSNDDKDWREALLTMQPDQDTEFTIYPKGSYAFDYSATSTKIQIPPSWVPEHLPEASASNYEVYLGDAYLDSYPTQAIEIDFTDPNINKGFAGQKYTDYLLFHDHITCHNAASPYDGFPPAGQTALQTYNYMRHQSDAFVRIPHISRMTQSDLYWTYVSGTKKVKLVVPYTFCGISGTTNNNKVVLIPSYGGVGTGDGYSGAAVDAPYQAPQDWIEIPPK